MSGGANEFAQILSLGCLMSFSTLIVPRRIYERFGDFDESITANDLDQILRWSVGGVIFGLSAAGIFDVSCPCNAEFEPSKICCDRKRLRRDRHAHAPLSHFGARV